MKKIVYWLTLFLLFSMGTFAATASDDSCDSFLGQKYVEVQFTVVGTPGTYQDIHVQQGGNTPQVLWYTEDVIEDTNKTEYIFNEQTLKESVEYQVLFVNDSDNQLARYYRRNLSAGNQHWQLIEETSSELKSGNLSVLSDGNVSGLSCSSGVTVPEVPEIELDICSYVPNSAQTNDYVDGLPSSSSSLNITSSGNFLYIPKANPTLSFANVSQVTDNNCNVNGQQVICSVDPKLTFPNFPPELEDYDTSETVYHDVDVSGNYELKPGKYRNLSFLTENSTLTLESGSYYFNEMTFNKQNTQVIIKDNKAAEVHYKKIDFGNHDIKFNVNSVAENFLLIGHGADADIDIVSANSVINGYVYVDPAAKTNGGFILSGSNTTITGGVSASSVNIEGWGTHKIGQSNNGECLSNSVDSDYTLVLSPESEVALVCEDITPTVSVMDNGQLASDFTGTVVVSIDGAEQTFSGASNQFTIQSGGKSQTVLVTAYIEGDQADSLVSGSYEFVPYKFAADDHYVVAGKAQSVEVKALACDDNGGVVDVGYSGSPTVQHSWHAPSGGLSPEPDYAPVFTSGTANSDLLLDEAGKVEIVLEDTNFDCSELADCPIEGSIDLKGNFMVYSRPWTFALCSTSSTDIYSAIGTSLGGDGFIAAGAEFDLQVLPIKYQAANTGEVESNSAWCNSGNITSNFFLDSSFSNHVKLSSEVATPESPASSVLLVSSDEMTKPRVSSDNEYQFTNLYWNDVGSLKVMASTENYAATCTSPVGLQSWYECTQLGYRNIGRFYPDKLVLISNEWNYESGHNGFAYMNQPITYDFVVEAQNTNGGATTNYGHFDPSLIADIKLLVVDQTDEANELDRRIEEYDIHFWGGEDKQWIDKDSQDGSRLKIDDFSFQFNKNQTSSSPVTTLEDGPYTDGFGLRVTSTVDDVDFVISDDTKDSNGSIVYTGVPFPRQPDIRYGRMSMEDVGGASVHTIKIPLRTEYWNGTRFVTNDDDSASFFRTSSDYVCAKRVWTDSGSMSAAALSGAENAPAYVNHGISDELSATPHSSSQGDSVREQIRFWLRTVNLLAEDDVNSTSPQISEDDVVCGSSYTDQPWLQYNWRNKGDEDPSSVVTFGIHRGNDRVIYRGEPGLTGL